MKRGERHYTEEELLFYVLGDVDAEVSRGIAAHLQSCSECDAVRNGYAQVRNQILAWKVEEPPEESWERGKARLLDSFRHDQEWLRQHSFLRSLRRVLTSVWDYAVENPLPTMGYIAAAVAFATERTITVFRLDQLLPNTNEVLEILKQVL